MSQIDFVPSICLLLGLPIPFSNLGSLIPHLFNFCPWWQSENNKIKQVYHTVKALRLNAHQVRNYLKAYAKISDEFPYIQFAELDLMFNKCESQLQEMVTMIHIDDDRSVAASLRSARDSYLQYLQDVKAMCRSIWAKFDMSCMLLGSVTLVTAVILLAHLLIQTDISHQVPSQMYVGMVGAGWVVLFVMFLYSVGLGTTGLIVSLSLGFPAIVISTHVVSRVIQIDPNATKEQTSKKPLSGGLLKDWDVLDLLASVCLLLYVGGMFSNSYVVYEDCVTSFMLQSLSWLLFIRTSYYLSVMQSTSDQSSLFATTRKTKSWRFDIGRVFTSPKSILFMMVVLFNVLVRLASNFKGCREEQWKCYLSPFLQPLSALTADMMQYKNIRYFFSVICMAVVPLSVKKWLKHHGNLNGYSPMVTVTSYALPVAVVCVCFHWALQGLPQKVVDALPLWQVLLLPQMVYAITALFITILVVSPLTLLMIKNTDDDPISYMEGETSETFVPKAYHHIKQNWQKHLSPSTGSASFKQALGSRGQHNRPPMVYGLGTVYSSTFIILASFIVIVVAMLLGDGMAPSVVLQLAAMLVLLELHATYINAKGKGKSPTII